MKEIIIRRFVEDKFSELCVEVQTEYKKSSHYKINKIIGKLFLPLFIIGNALFIFVIFVLFTDIVVRAVSFVDGSGVKALFIFLPLYIIGAFIYFVSINSIVIWAYNINNWSFPSGRYYFDGFDKHAKKLGNQWSTVGEFFSVRGLRKIKIKKVKNPLSNITSCTISSCLIALFITFILNLYIFILIKNTEAIYDSEKNVLLLVLIIPCITLYVSHIILLTYRFINKIKYHMKYKSINYPLFEIKVDNFDLKEKEPYYMKHFLKKVYVMSLLSENTSKYQFITEKNYIQFLGQLAQTTSYELISFSDEFEYFSSNEYFNENKIVKMGIDLCIKSLLDLNVDFISEEDQVKYSKLLMVKNDVLVETKASYENFYIRSSGRIAVSISQHGILSNIIEDNLFSNQLVDARYVRRENKLKSLKVRSLRGFDEIIYNLDKLSSREKTGKKPKDKNIQNKSSYFRLFNVKSNLYGFVGYDSSYVQSMMVDDNDYYSDYKTYQFVLKSENELEKKDDVYYLKGDLKSQLFYNNMLIINDEVLKHTKKYFNAEEIKVSCNEEIYSYYICTPKNYSDDVIDSTMSQYFESIERSFIKESILVEPCIIEKKAETLKVFGVLTKRVINYQYNENYQYPNVFITEEIYENICNCDGIQLIRNARSITTNKHVLKKEQIQSINNLNVVEEYSNKYFDFVKNDNIYTYSEEDRKAIRKKNVFTIMLLVCCALILVFINYNFRNLNNSALILDREINTNNIRIHRFLFLIDIPLMVFAYKRFRTIIVSPTAIVLHNKLVHNVRSIPKLGNSYKVNHSILKDDLTMAFFKDKVMFELPIENKEQYINDEIYYNGTSYAMCGVKIKPEQIVEEGEQFVSHLHYAYYINNKKWLSSIK